MSEHNISLKWERSTPDFRYDTFDRTHDIRFEGGKILSSSAAPAFKGRDEFANPEEMLAAALSSCHMLTFLAVAARKNLIVDTYEDAATATLAKNEVGKMAVTRVVLRPRVKLQDAVSLEQFRELHEKAHANCFIALSVKCEVVVDPELV